MVRTLTQGHLVPLVITCPPDRVPAAILRRVGGMDFDGCSASFFRFAEQPVKKSRPRCVVNAFSQTMIMRHPVNVQVFDGNHTKAVNNVSAFLVGEIVTPEADTLMDTRYHLAVLTSDFRAFGQFGVLALHLSKSLLFVAKEARVGDLFPSGERRKRCETDINPHLGLNGLKDFRLTLDGEGNIPLAGTASPDGTSLQRALDRAMRDHLHRADLGERHTSIMGGRLRNGDYAEAGLGKGEAIVAIRSTETGKAWGLTGLAASEKGFEGQVNPNSDILKHLGMHTRQGRTLVFQNREGIDLPVAGQAFPALFIGVLTGFQQMVIQPTALLKGFVELGHLLLGGKETILKHFLHAQVIAQRRTSVNSFLRLRAARLISPWLKPEVLRRGLIN